LLLDYAPPDLKYDAISGCIMESQVLPNNSQKYAFDLNNTQNWQDRSRGYSYGGNNRNDRNGRQQARNNGNNSQNISDRHNTFRKQSDGQNNNNQNNRGAFDRGSMKNNASRQSPRRNMGIVGNPGVYCFRSLFLQRLGV